MKRLVAALAAVVVMLIACSTNTTFSRGGLSGANAVALTDGYVFMTSADTNDLRVLRLDIPESNLHAFVSAPNPLESLSIPTINRPTSVAVDDRYDENGRIAHGSYLIVSRPGATEVSIVGADPSEFREVARLVTPGPLTAATAVKLTDDTSRFYLAVYDGTQSTLYSVDLPTSTQALRALNAAQRSALTKSVVSFGDDPVAALLPVPGLQGRVSDGQTFCAAVNHCVVVATRGSKTAAGKTIMLDPVSLQTAPLNYPGPVRTLTTHGRTVEVNQATNEQFVVGGAGSRIFALLDEDKCGGLSCGGLLAVDAVIADSSKGGFQIANDGTGAQMLPLTFGNSLPVSVSIGASFTLTDPGKDRTVRLLSYQPDGGAVLEGFSAVGVVTSANGQITFFNAGTLQQIDGNSLRARAHNAVFADPSGFILDYVAGLDAGTDPATLDATAITVGDGVWNSQNIYIYWEGVISDAPFPINGASTTLALPAAILGRLKLQDFVVFINAAGRCADSKITAIGADSVTLDTVPAGCSDVTAFEVRAGPAAPFAIFRTTVPQFLGRARAGQEFVYNAPVTVRPNGFDAGVPPTPALAMGFGTVTDIDPPPRGASWQFAISSGFAPYAFVVDTNSVGCNTQLPGSVVFDERRTRVYVVYPGSNSLVDVDPAFTQRLLIGTGNNAFCYR